MTSFANEYEWAASQAPKDLPTLFVPMRPRKDGKFAVVYAYTGRSFNKLISAETLASEKASGQYNIRTRY